MFTSVSMCVNPSIADSIFDSVNVALLQCCFMLYICIFLIISAYGQMNAVLIQIYILYAKLNNIRQ